MLVGMNICVVYIIYMCMGVFVSNVCVCTWACVCECERMCWFVSSCQAIKVLISKYLATRRVVMSVGGVNGLERQLLTSLIHAP